MTELRVHNVAISLDGYGAGPAQTEQDPLGAEGERLHEWIFSGAVRRPRRLDLYGVHPVRRGRSRPTASRMSRL
jgi:hypothetical protein